jgi:hypothetical protein
MELMVCDQTPSACASYIADAVAAGSSGYYLDACDTCRVGSLFGAVVA